MIWLIYDISQRKRSCPQRRRETYKDTNVVRISPLIKTIALEPIILLGKEIQGTGHRGENHEEGRFGLSS